MTNFATVYANFVLENSISAGKRFNFSAKYLLLLLLLLLAFLPDGRRDRAHGVDDFAAEGHALGEAATAEGGADQTLQPTPEAQRGDVQRRTGAQARPRPQYQAFLSRPFLISGKFETRKISLTSFSSQIF